MRPYESMALVPIHLTRLGFYPLPLLSPSDQPLSWSCPQQCFICLPGNSPALKLSVRASSDLSHLQHAVPGASLVTLPRCEPAVNHLGIPHPDNPRDFEQSTELGSKQALPQLTAHPGTVGLASRVIFLPCQGTACDFSPLLRFSPSLGQHPSREKTELLR